MNKNVRFSELRQLLEGLGFTCFQKPKWVAFEHAASDTLIVLRKYRANEVVSPTDLAAASTMLDQRGLLEAETFKKALTEATV